MKQKKGRKAHRPLTSFVNPMACFQPMPKASADAMMLQFYSALEAVARGAEPDVAEWRILADAVNHAETAMLQGKLPTSAMLPIVNAGSEAMVGAAERFRAGKGMRLDAEGLQAVRALLGVLEQLLALLTEREMVRVVQGTRERVAKIRLHGGEPGQNVVIV